MELIIGGIFAVLVAIFGFFKFGKSKGAAEANSAAKEQAADIKVATAQKTAETETDTLEKANHVQNEVSKAGVNAIADGLRDKYTRD